MPLVSSVDYAARRIYLSAESVGVALDTMLVYREVRALRRATEVHRRFLPMIIGGGNIQKTATSYTQPYVQLLYGCRIVPFDVDHTLSVIRETFTDDGAAGAGCFDRTATVSNVDIDVQVAAVEVREVVVGGGLSSEQATRLARIEKFLRNKQVTDPLTGTMVVFDDDGVTPLAIGTLFEDAAGTQAYRGSGAERRERLA